MCTVNSSSYVELHRFLSCSCEAVSVRQVRVNNRAAFNQFVTWASVKLYLGLCKSFKINSLGLVFGFGFVL